MKKNTVQTVQNEKRFLVKVKSFEKIPAKQFIYKTIWYFENEKISMYQNNDIDKTRYFVTKKSQYGKSTKKASLKVIESPSQKQELISTWDRIAKYKVKSFAKCPTINNKRCYIEQLKGKDFEFYSTESEIPEHEERVELLNELPGVKVLKNLGEVSLWDILENKLYK
jgi:hypothetical protein